jgi:hypothetical protein
MNQVFVRNLVVLFGSVLIIGLGVSTVYRSGPHRFGSVTWGSEAHRTDFTVYQQAGKAVLDGTNIYEAHNIRDWYYMYLPVFAVAMVPFALLSVFWASLLWYLLSVLMIGHAVYLSVQLARRILPKTELSNFWLYTLTMLLVLRATLSGITRGQASLLVTYLVVISVWLYVQRREWFAGFCLAGSIVLKIFPALLVLYFLAKRRYRMVVATGVWLVVLIWIAPSCIFGVRGNNALLRQWVTTIALPANKPEQAANNVRYGQMINPRLDRNQSVQAVFIRWLAGSTTETADPSREALARRVAVVVNLCLLLITAWGCRRGRAEEDRPETTLQLCVIVLLMLFLSPVSWNHNYTLLVLPLAVAVAASTDASGGSSRTVFGVALAFFLILILLSLVVKPLYVFGALLWSALTIWAAFVWKLNRPQTS